MLIQINSGKGPLECEMAVQLFLHQLMKEVDDIQILSIKRRNAQCVLSVILETKSDLSYLEGSIQWICKSPIRKHHKRQNWFIDVSILKENIPCDLVNDIRYEVIHSRGKGGQNVNKVATGIRAIHLPTNTTVVCMEERSQHMNKQKALQKLMEKLKLQNQQQNLSIDYENWNQHNQIIRGNPIRIYKGLDFNRMK